MSFNPEQQYEVIEDLIPIKDFSDYAEEYVTRPPYQRKNVWLLRKKQNLLDSLFRRYYIPKIVIREVRLGENRTIREIIDGQQRIIAAQEFIRNELRLPKTLKDLSPELPGQTFQQLSVEMRRFVGKELKYKADIVKGIEDPRNPDHQKLATEIFWRLQQGDSLNFMEIAHARLNSVVRNFVVKYSDNISFDFDEYRPLDDNPDRHPFFKIIERDNNRLQHLMLLSRFLLLELADGPTELKDSAIEGLIEDSSRKDGIGNYEYEDEPVAKRVLLNLDALYDVFKDDPMIGEGDSVHELNREYIMVSLYLLIRHLRQYYVFSQEQRILFRDFFSEFYQRWLNPDDEDRDVLSFSEHRQQDQRNVESRHLIIRQLFFQYATEQNKELMLKDTKRVFNEAEKITIYRRDKGLCQDCLREGKSEREATVAWSEYQADHVIPHTKGGHTVVFNGQVLCRYHNARKGGS